jgi:hypothetical protein
VVVMTARQAGFTKGQLEGDSLTNGQIASEILRLSSEAGKLLEDEGFDAYASEQVSFKLGAIAGLSQRIRYV